jgi:hypothetical protein
MHFDSAPWPNAVTIGKLIDRTMLLEAHCHRCGRCKVLDPRKLLLPLDAPVPALEGRFRCERCGSTETSARPHFEQTWPSGRSDASASRPA